MACWKYRTQKSPKSRHLRTIVQLRQAVSSQLRHVSTIGKNLLSSNIACRCSHNMVNFCLVVAEIDPVIWGTPANFNSFRVLAALLHGSHIVSQPNFAALNRGLHLCSAGRPSRWALAHILVKIINSHETSVIKLSSNHSTRQSVDTSPPRSTVVRPVRAVSPPRPVVSSSLQGSARSELPSMCRSSHGRTRGTPSRPTSGTASLCTPSTDPTQPYTDQQCGNHYFTELINCNY